MWLKFILVNFLLYHIVFSLPKNNNNKTIYYKKIYETKPFVHKCCRKGQAISHAWNRSCKRIHNDLDFNEIVIYDETIRVTKKAFEDVFNVVPGRFYTKGFKKHLRDVRWLGVIPHLTETGVLQVEYPNVYERWTPIQPGNFCVDYRLTKNRTKANLRFYAIVPELNFVRARILSIIHDNINPFFTAGIIISCFFLFLVFIVYVLLPELRNLCGMILMAYTGSLFMAFILVAVMQITYDISHYFCIGLTMSIYFFFLSTFCWMNVMSYDIWWTFRGYVNKRPIHRRGECFKFKMYSLYAFGVPFLMTIVLEVVNSLDLTHIPWFIQPKFPEKGCFIQGGQKLVYLYIPMLILIVSNWIFYVMTAYNIWRLNCVTAILDTDAAGTPQAHRSQIRRFVVYLKLSVVMGLNWILEIVSFVYPMSKMMYISEIYNVLIGLAIFFIFVFKKEIYVKILRRYNIAKWRHQPAKKCYFNSPSDYRKVTSSL